MKKKIALYMSGNYAKFLKFLPKYMPESDFISYSQNYKAYKTIGNSKFFLKNFYLYKDFNLKYKNYSNSPVDDKINGFKVLITDKSHFKRLSAAKQEKILNTMYSIFVEWINDIKPDFIFIPIIESIDAMLIYQICKSKKIEPVCYCHARHINTSFFSDSDLETLPKFYKKIQPLKEHEIRAKKIALLLKNNDDKLNYNQQLEYIFNSFKKKNQITSFTRVNVFSRLLLNLRLKIFNERRNETLRLWIKFQVFIERFLVPIQRLFYTILEYLYLKPIKSLPNEFDYFPLHFSPESSINTPAPFYIDQLRVVDRILINRKNTNRTLIVKEHPSMYFKRKLSFYKELKKKPYVRLITKTFDSLELIKKSEKVYSVTGTACMEAFYLGKKWEMLGKNFLPVYLKQNPESSIYNFTLDTLKVSGDFILLSPPNKNNIKFKVLFSEQNFINMSKYFNFYIENINS